MASVVLEGKWDEVIARTDPFPGKRLRVEIYPDETDSGHVSTYELPPAERARRFREWAEGHRRDTPGLSDEAISRESIYSRDD